MEQAITFREASPLLMEQISHGGKVVFSPHGTSMTPTLRQGKDKVVLVAPPEELRVRDVPFYLRPSGQPVLHRIVGRDPDGSYITCGDNQSIPEHGVKREQIFAVMEGFYRGSRYVACGSAGEGWYLFRAKVRIFFRKVQYRLKKLSHKKNAS